MSTPKVDLALLQLRILELAGYEGPAAWRDMNQLVHEEFHAILTALEEVAGRKVNGYGPFRYDELEPDWRWEIQSLYQDIERKFGRLKTLVRANPVTIDHANDVIEILGDLSVYAARGIQIVARLETLLKKG